MLRHQRIALAMAGYPSASGLAQLLNATPPAHFVSLTGYVRLPRFESLNRASIIVSPPRGIPCA